MNVLVQLTLNMQNKFRQTEKHLNFLIPIPFLLILFLIIPRIGRFEDENYGMLCGYYLIKSLFSFDTSIAQKAAEYDSTNGIGLVLCIPSSLLFEYFKSISIVRIYSSLHAFFYWAGILAVFYEVSNLIKLNLTIYKKLIYGFLALCFIQAVPWSFQNQAMLLSEFPALCFLIWGTYFYLKNNFKIGSFFFGIATIYKFVFIAYFLALLIILIFNKSKELFKNVLLFFIPFLFIQFIRLIAFGPTIYIDTLKNTFHWITLSSGSGITGKFSNELVEPINEWRDGYTWREKGYYIIATFFPILTLFLTFKFKLNKTLKIIAAALCAVILIGSFQWYVLAFLKWWRRTYYFLVPGYVIATITSVLIYESLSKRLLPLLRHFTLLLLGLLALYVQIRQTIYSAFEHSKPLNNHQTHYMDWDDKYSGTK